MRPLWVILIALSLGQAGCSSTGKKSANSNTSRPKDRGNDSNPFWSENQSTLPRTGGSANERAPASSEYSGILAGTVVDASDRPLPGVIVNFTEANAPPGSAPKGIESDRGGFFMIRGLKPDVMYMLTFRADDGGHVLGGSAQAKPPNSHMLIRVTEGNVTTLTPPAQPNPAGTGPYAPKEISKDPPGKDRSKDPPPPAKTPPPPQLEPVPANARDPLTEGEDYSPSKTTPPASRSFPTQPPRPVPSNNVAIDPLQPPIPAMNIPGPNIAPPSSPKYMEPPPPAAPAMYAEPVRNAPITQATAPAPDMSQRAKTRLEFTVYDLSGRPWNFRNHTGKLVLLDFWSTGCVPCLKAIPKLIDLQNQYRPDDLEIIGIACEKSGTFDDQAAAVNRIKLRYAETSKPINYSIFLEGTDFKGRVQDKFGVRAYPTMILLDERGQVLWRSDRQQANRLEDAVKYYLSK